MNTILFTTSPMTFDDSLHDHRPIHQKYHKALKSTSSRLPVTQSPLVITNRPRSFPYQAEASSRSTGGVFSAYKIRENR